MHHVRLTSYTLQYFLIKDNPKKTQHEIQEKDTNHPKKIWATVKGITRIIALNVKQIGHTSDCCKECGSKKIKRLREQDIATNTNP